jgi:Domain of unknown function (DUF1929)
LRTPCELASRKGITNFICLNKFLERILGELAMRRNKFLGPLHGASILRGTTAKILCAFMVIAGAMVTSAKVFSIGPNLAKFITSFDVALAPNKPKAPVNYGYGPGLGIGSPRPNYVLGQTPAIPKAANAAPKAANAAPAIPPGAAAWQGYFGQPVTWPFIPIHMALLPDGRVMTYGRADPNLQLEARYVYDIWDPKLGTGANAHTLLPNTTPGNTDIFCGAATLLGSGFVQGANGNGQLLIVGGAPPAVINGVVSNNNVTLFNPTNDTLTAAGTMNYARWYPSIMTLRNGDKLVLGGAYSETVLVPTPEVYNATTGWRALPGISISGGILVDEEWFYPKAYVGGDGAVYLLQYDGRIFRLTTTGAGTMTDTGARMSPGFEYYPTVMILPFKVVSVRANQVVQLVDISVNPPVVTTLPYLNQDRQWADGTLLADGGVMVSGGSGVNNELTNVDYQAAFIEPWSSGLFLPAASAAIPRLYHQATLLLPDGSVLTGGGGDPGPVNELNAEIYYPYYLYLNDGSGLPAPRPTIVSAPSTLNVGQYFSMTVGSNDQILYINLIRMGFATHTSNLEQRRIPVPFAQNGATITAGVTNSPESTPPGYYMLFVFNQIGTASIAKIVFITQSVSTSP